MDMAPKLPATKEKHRKIRPHCKKNISASKDTMKRVNTQRTKWKKICANHTYDKGLASKIPKLSLKLNNKKRTNQ